MGSRESRELAGEGCSDGSEIVLLLVLPMLVSKFSKAVSLKEDKEEGKSRLASGVEKV